jgi:hypothetical protein
MYISTQTLNDALIAILVTVGIAVALSITMIAIGGLFERNKKLHASRNAADPTQRVTQKDDSRELVLR